MLSYLTMAGHTENPKVPTLDKGTPLPKIVRATAITLLIYGVAMFSLGVYQPIWAYNNIIIFPIYILIGTAIILISFGLFKGGYSMLHREAYGAGVGIAATMWGFFPAVWLIYAMVPESHKDWTGGSEAMKYLVMFLFLLLNVIFLYALSRADKILKRVG